MPQVPARQSVVDAKYSHREVKQGFSNVCDCDHQEWLVKRMIGVQSAAPFQCQTAWVGAFRGFHYIEERTHMH